MKDNKGQALVEFVIILPIFLLLIMSVIDFGNIITKKYALENDIDSIYHLYKERKMDEINSYVNKNKLAISYRMEDEMLIISISEDVKIISPILNLVFGKNYEINTEKSMYNE